MAHARWGAILPHAPLLALHAPGARANEAIGRVRAAARACARDLGGTLLVVSPHARETGVYLSRRAGLRGFGLPRADAPVDIDAELSTAIASGWGRPTLVHPLDHGIVVPLELLSWRGPVVAIGLGESEPDIADAAEALADVIAPVPVSLVASVNGGAGVTARGPLTRLPGGLTMETELRQALQDDLSLLQALWPRLASEAGSCGAGPLLVLARLFRGLSMDVLAHEWPYGVGYPVAITRSDT